MTNCHYCNTDFDRYTTAHVVVMLHGKVMGHIQPLPTRHYYHSTCYIRLLDSSGPITPGRLGK